MAGPRRSKTEVVLGIVVEDKAVDVTTHELEHHTTKGRARAPKAVARKG